MVDPGEPRSYDRRHSPAKNAGEVVGRIVFERSQRTGSVGSAVLK